jgi:hypothetical protein
MFMAFPEVRCHILSPEGRRSLHTYMKPAASGYVIPGNGMDEIRSAKYGRANEIGAQPPAAAGIVGLR